MSQTFVEGTRIPVTWIEVGPCTVTQIKTKEHDGYWAVQLGFGTRNLKNTSKPLQGHLRKALEAQSAKDKAQNKTPRFLREVRLDKEPEFKVGDVVTITDIFKKGDVVAVSGISKGKGFAGVVKRWHFAGGPRTHGQSDRERAPGAIGQGTTPGRIWKGKHMAGRMGSDRVTIKNIFVVDVDKGKNMLAVSGPIPGIPGGLVIIKKIAEGKLEELVEETPQVEVQQVEEETSEKSESKESSDKTATKEKED